MTSSVCLAIFMKRKEQLDVHFAETPKELYHVLWDAMGTECDVGTAEMYFVGELGHARVRVRYRLDSVALRNALDVAKWEGAFAYTIRRVPAPPSTGDRHLMLTMFDTVRGKFTQCVKKTREEAARCAWEHVLDTRDPMRKERTDWAGVSVERALETANARPGTTCLYVYYRVHDVTM